MGCFHPYFWRSVPASNLHFPLHSGTLLKKTIQVTSTNMQKWLSKNYSWIVLNLPAFAMFITLVYQSSLWQVLTLYSGYTALILLIIVLSLNPLQALFPTVVLIKKVNRFRRQFGVAVFSYAVIHFICFFIKQEYSISETLIYFIHPAILPAYLAFIIFSLLALTSNNYFVKKMGFLRWNKLHKTIYIAEGFVFLHMVLVGDVFYAFVAFVPLVILQFLRRKKKKSKIKTK
jgi:sulfoxide reductase heme-binding subunit YedZ